MKYSILLWIICVIPLNAQISDFKEINFQKADRIAETLKGEKLDNLPKLVHSLTSDLSTDVERFRAIFSWICNNISNDYQLFAKNMRKRRKFMDDSIQLAAWNDKFKKTFFKKLRKRKKTICTGYAFLLKKMANYAGIECEIVHGFARTSTTDPEKLNIPNHSWNVVKLDGKWYLCDPTWASGLPNPFTKKFTFDYNKGFFLSDPRLFAVNHYPIERKWFLLEDSSQKSFGVFLNAPVLYNDAYAYFRSHEQPIAMHTILLENESLELRFETKKAFSPKDVHFIVESHFSEKRRRPSYISLKDQKFHVVYKFTTTGYYDVHLYIKDDLIATYTVEVKKRT